MVPPARWAAMDSPVKPANDEGGGARPEPCDTPTQQPSPSGLTGGSMVPPARWATMDSPVKPANDERERGETGAKRLPPPNHRHPPA